MAEYIEREALLADIDAAIDNNGMGYVVGQTIKRYVKRLSAVDPIHELGGCYCWECIRNVSGHCTKMGGTSVIQTGFCGYGRRKER